LTSKKRLFTTFKGITLLVLVMVRIVGMEKSLGYTEIMVE